LAKIDVPDHERGTAKRLLKGGRLPRLEEPAMSAGLRWHLLHAAAGVATAALLYWLDYGRGGSDLGDGPRSDVQGDTSWASTKSRAADDNLSSIGYSGSGHRTPVPVPRHCYAAMATSTAGRRTSIAQCRVATSLPQKRSSGLTKIKATPR